MNYLKIFLNLTIIFILIFLTGCVSDAVMLSDEKLPGPPEKVSSPPKLYKPALPVPSVKEIVSIDKEKPESVKWVTVEPENISPVILLPMVVIREKVAAPKSPPEYSGFYNINLRINDRKLKPEQQIITVADSEIPGIKDAPIRKAVNNSVIETEQAISVPLKNEAIDEDKKSPSVTEQEIKVLVSDKIKITLPGNGWIYLPDKENSTLNYSGREFTSENTVYTFRPEKEGNFVLNFQFQDLIKNIYTKEKVHLIVYSKLSESDSEIIPADAVVKKSVISAPVDLNKLLKGYLSTKNIEGIFNIVPDLVRSTNPEVHSLLPETAELLYSSSHFVPSALILETLVMDKNYTAPKDRFLYLLGKSYEKDSPIRNELIAADYYKQLLDTYPASIYWDESRDRYRFLKRRYIDIR